MYDVTEDYNSRFRKVILLMFLVSILFIIILFTLAPSASAITLEQIFSGGQTTNNNYSNIYYNNTTSIVYNSVKIYNVIALTSSPADSVRNYFGEKPSALTTSAGQNKIYFRSAGNITNVEVYQYSGTAGTAEPYSLYIRKNGLDLNSTGFVKTVASATNERIFNNNTIKVPISNGDYIEFVFYNPIWATNPLTTITGGYFEVSV